MVQQSIYESLLIFNPAKGDTTPWLATEWKSAEDGKSITFTLRDGVKWSDGQPLVADDVAYTFELQKKIKGGYDYLDTVTADGANKVTFSFNKPWSPGPLRPRPAHHPARSTSGPRLPIRRRTPTPSRWAPARTRRWTASRPSHSC